MTHVELFLTLWTQLQDGVWKVQGEFALGAFGSSSGEGRPQEQSRSVCDQLTTLNACLGSEASTSLAQCFGPDSDWPFRGSVERRSGRKALFAEPGATEKTGATGDGKTRRPKKSLSVLKAPLDQEGGEVYWAFETERA